MKNYIASSKHVFLYVSLGI